MENICAGLTESFVKECDLNLVADGSSFEIPGYVIDNQGKYYKYNQEISNIYYCENNVVIVQDRIAHQYDKSKYELFDQFLLDKENKKIVNLSESEDYLTDLIQNIQKIEVNKLSEHRQIVITTTEGEQKILINKNNAIIGYENINATIIGDDFLCNSKVVKEINLPNVTTIGDKFLYCNKKLTEINLPNVTTIGNRFLRHNEVLTEINLPNVSTIGECFLEHNNEITEIDLPNVTTIGNYFLFTNEKLTEIQLPNATTIGKSFLYDNKVLTKINLPNVTTIGDSFLRHNLVLTEINLPNVTTIGDFFLEYNNELTEINLPNVTTIGKSFLPNNEKLTKINIPKEAKSGSYFCSRIIKTQRCPLKILKFLTVL